MGVGVGGWGKKGGGRWWWVVTNESKANFGLSLAIGQIRINLGVVV